METVFICYPKCSTCAKAKKWLQENNMEFEERNIVEDIPTKEELQQWVSQSGLELKKFFNTSGLVYKNLNLKEKLLTMPEEQQLTLLVSNGMLIKRPILVRKETILVGFKEKEWEEILK